MKYSHLQVSGTFLLLLVAWTASFAKNNPDRTQFSRDIHVDAGEKTGDLTCVNCSIYVLGQAAGDVTTVHGSVVVENGGKIAGDVTAVWGNIRNETGSQVSGDLTAVAGAVRRDPQATVGGDITALEGRKWVLAIILPPLFGLGVLIALIIWLMQRSREKRSVTYAQAGGQSHPHV